MNDSHGSLPADLVQFLHDNGVQWYQAKEITARRWSSLKRSFRLTLNSDKLVKVRLLLPGRSAETIKHLLQLGSGAKRCARIMAVNGRCILEEWIEGEPLPLASCDSDTLIACGRSLAEIHNTPLPTKPELIPQNPSALDRLLQDISILTTEGWLTTSETNDLLCRAMATMPSFSREGLVHFDYCGENIILHKDRGPLSIDNETITLGSFSLDIARTFVRWGLDDKSQGLFLSGYLAADGPAELECLRFWSVVALAWSAAIRIRHGNQDCGPQISALRRLISD